MDNLSSVTKQGTSVSLVTFSVRYLFTILFFIFSLSLFLSRSLSLYFSLLLHPSIPFPNLSILSLSFTLPFFLSFLLSFFLSFSSTNMKYKGNLFLSLHMLSLLYKLCNIMAEGFRFMLLGLVRLRTFRLSAWVA